MASKTEEWTPEQYQQFLQSKTTKKRAKVKPRWNILNADQSARVVPLHPDQRDLITEIVFPGSLPGNNGQEGLLRMPSWKRTQLRNRLTLHIQSLTRNRHTGPVRVELVRHSVGRDMDFDNLVSTGKLILDSLKMAGVITDDCSQVITQRDYQQTKASNHKSQMTIIRIIDLPL